MQPLQVPSRYGIICTEDLKYDSTEDDMGRILRTALAVTLLLSFAGVPVLLAESVVLPHPARDAATSVNESNIATTLFFIISSFKIMK